MNMAASPEDVFQRHQRQVHLDFHTSPLIPDVASEFDAEAFARTLAEAHVNSVTLTAKCHHGMCYFPTPTGRQHPALRGRDLLGEQLAALHRHGLRAPIYTTIGWEEDAAARHPAWRQCLPDGSHAVSRPHGPWRYLNFLHPDYQDYVETHLREICARYGAEVDGFFLDIVSFAPDACWSETSVRFRDKLGLAADDPATPARFQAAAQEAFARRFTTLLHDIAPPAATVFYNAASELSVDSTVGPRRRYGLMTHAEIESLPSGKWGYQHFPRVARAIGNWGKPWLGMTGRFQRGWGDFGGLKPLAALEYECFRSQALGGANSVGDQLPPRGALEPDAYRLIGQVYAQCAAAESFYAGSVASPQFGSLCAGYPGLDPHETAASDEGAMLMAADQHREVAMIDERADLSAFELVQLPDTVVVTPLLRAKLRDYYLRGGRLLLSYRSGFDAAGDWALDFLPLSIRDHGADVRRFPTYWRTSADSELYPAVGDTDRVCYMAGVEVEAGVGARVLVERVLPYFQRTPERFSSHSQVPAQAVSDPSPAIVRGERFVYFADPIFREFRQAGNLMMRDAWHLAMNALIDAPPYGDGLPKTILSVPRRRGDDLILTLLHYIPTRKAREIDLIEERSGFAGEQLRLPARVTSARLFNGPALERAADGTFLLPVAKGRLLVEVPEFYGG